MAKKPVKASTRKPQAAKPENTPEAKAAAADPVPVEQPSKAKLPPVPPRPVPPHQQFLSKGPKAQPVSKGRIFRHQGR